jgi:hypothetical protein
MGKGLSTNELWDRQSVESLGSSESLKRCVDRASLMSCIRREATTSIRDPMRLTVDGGRTVSSKGDPMITRDAQCRHRERVLVSRRLST